MLPRATWRSIALPTPMATAQATLPVALAVYDRERKRDGAAPLRPSAIASNRSRSTSMPCSTARNCPAITAIWNWFTISRGRRRRWLAARAVPLRGPRERPRRRDQLRRACVQHGADLQGRAAILCRPAARPFDPACSCASGPRPCDTLCHLIYPASTPWHGESATDLESARRQGRGGGAQANRDSLLGLASLPLSRDASIRRLGSAAGGGAYIIIRDLTCRLFGYHGLLRRDGGFSLDHMFGF